jgi:hypothetical protein
MKSGKSGSPPGKAVQSKDEILARAREVYSLFRDACQRYDDGQLAQALTIANTVYVFAHDRGKSAQSILSLLGVQTQFASTMRPINPKNLLTEYPGTIMRLGSGKFTYLPRLDEDHGDGQPYPAWVAKSRWWEQTVIKAPSTMTLSRKNVICGMRNEAGGGHVSKFMDEIMAGLTREPGGGWVALIEGQGTVLPERGPHFATTRQIGHELELTLRRATPEVVM